MRQTVSSGRIVSTTIIYHHCHHLFDYVLDLIKFRHCFFFTLILFVTIQFMFCLNNNVLNHFVTFFLSKYLLLINKFKRTLVK